ncbi:MAG: hypothetical protein PHD41_05485 [Methanosarcinaceae archaeon]|nr:hypothetical protein [Methanosarcinaceae archaeon]
MISVRRRTYPRKKGKRISPSCKTSFPSSVNKNNKVKARRWDTHTEKKAYLRGCLSIVLPINNPIRIAPRIPPSVKLTEKNSNNPNNPSPMPTPINNIFLVFINLHQNFQKILDLEHWIN